LKKQQIILITGATSGIGRFTALYLARQGHRVFASGRSQRALDELAANAQKQTHADAQKQTHAGAHKQTGALETLRLDVTDDDSIAAARAEVDARTAGYGVDVLVNNAGYGAAGPTELITDEDWRAQYDVNVFGLMAMIRAFVPQMRARGAGRIVNVSSLGGRLTLPFLGSYNSTKYAVESLSDALRAELHPFGVRVSIVEPGVIDTGFTDRSMTEAEKYDRADSPYRPVLDRMGEIRKMSDSTAVGPECVARAIERASTARRPRPRYVAPLRAALGIGFLRALPTTWADALLRIAFGLTRRRFRAALAANSKLPQLPPRQINA
jgi:NAD(P)-dependent dehydrogenase (short-subunit alcohol dehydrogenase family)